MYKIPEKIKPEKCKLIKEYKLPMLILGTRFEVDLKNDLKWDYIIHKTGNIPYNNHYFKATTINVKPQLKKNINKICRIWGSQSPTWEPTLEDLIAYRNQLGTFLLTNCDKSYKLFEKGIYPIDPIPEYIKRISKENEIPDDLNTLIKEEYKIPFNIWEFLILGNQF